MMNPIQPGSNLDSGQGNALSLLQQRKIPCNIKFISPWNQGNKYTDNKFTLLFLLKLNFFFNLCQHIINLFLTIYLFDL
jgi:hypothetical protein